MTVKLLPCFSVSFVTYQQKSSYYFIWVNTVTFEILYPDRNLFLSFTPNFLLLGGQTDKDSYCWVNEGSNLAGFNRTALQNLMFEISLNPLWSTWNIYLYIYIYTFTSLFETLQKQSWPLPDWPGRALWNTYFGFLHPTSHRRMFL